VAKGPAPEPLGNLTAPIYDALLRETATIQGTTGTRIWLDVFRPETPGDVKVPVILVMTPYRALGDALGVLSCGAEPCPYDTDLVEFFVPRGYAVAFSDVRGNHNSGGCIDQTGPGQWQDGYDTVEWLGTQPWSNGRVGMYGISYDGETQHSTAFLQPPHLVTIVPAAAVSSQYDYVFFQGVPYELSAPSTMAAYFAISAVPGTDPGAVPHYPERIECQPENFQTALDRSGDHTPYWLDREYRLHMGKVNVSVLHIHGLADWNVKPNQIEGFFNGLTNASVKRGLYGQWPHAFPDREDWFKEGGILHRWYDHFLLGIDTGLLQELPPVLIEDTEGQWRGIDSFPPLNQSWLELHLLADGTLGDAVGEAVTLEVYDVPREAGYTFSPPYSGAPVDPAGSLGYALRGAPPRLVFESKPLAEPLRLTGVPFLTFTAETDATSTHWAALVEIVHSDGTVAWMNRGYQDTRHLAGLTNPKDLAPGEAYNVTLKMFPQEDVVPAGAKLRLTLSNDDDWIHQDTTYATSRVHVGDGSTVLHLPLAPLGQEYPADTLVPWTGGAP
ncbi:MAG TPA: CocE/NonD family hydrolase, partial [Candidatus Thermoplasmatota archaeon]|nr:CocE/NonD family hydrolase [Candidatus Thermoplasmatota archaeon]